MCALTPSYVCHDSGKVQFDDPIEHWMLVPRQKLVSLYVEEYSATMHEIIRMAHQVAAVCCSVLQRVAACCSVL